MVRKGPQQAGTIVVRFLDDEIMVGLPERLSLDDPDFVLQLADGTGNNERALVPLASIKRVTFETRPRPEPSWGRPSARWRSASRMARSSKAT